MDRFTIERIPVPNSDRWVIRDNKTKQLVIYKNKPDNRKCNFSSWGNETAVLIACRRYNREAQTS